MGAAAGAGGEEGKAALSYAQARRAAEAEEAAALSALRAEEGEVAEGGEGEGEGEGEQGGAAAAAELLGSLTGRPLPEDTVLFAVPVVAPFAALADYALKAKLTQAAGGVKKGQVRRAPTICCRVKRTKTDSQHGVVTPSHSWILGCWSLLPPRVRSRACVRACVCLRDAAR